MYGVSGTVLGFSIANVKASREMEERYMLLEELIEDEREQGRIEGKIEGKIENTQQILLKILSKTGEVPEKVKEIILKEEDQDILDGYLDKALSSETCDQFLERRNSINIPKINEYIQKMS